MREFPLFVPAGPDRVAAVVTAPDDEPRGFVLLLSGTGRHNSIGSTLSARLARSLAEEGLATGRLDYAGSGDSPGLVSEWNPAQSGAATAQAKALLDVARAAFGVQTFAQVGTCYGSRVALSLVDDPDCLGAVCLAPPILDLGGVGRVGRQLRGGRVGALVRSSAALRRVVRPARRLSRPRKAAGELARAFSHLGRIGLVFLYGDRNSQEDHLSGRARQTIEAAVASLPPERRSRFELHLFPGGPLTTFDGLPPSEQDQVMEVVIPHVTALFRELR